MRIQLLGRLRVEADGRVIDRFRTRKAAALLAYLAFYRDQTHSRDALIELLWPEERREVGRERLRTALSSLRRQLEPGPSSATRGCTPIDGILCATRDGVRLSSAITTDVAEFGAALRAASQAERELDRVHHLTAATELYCGELLPGFYEEWAVQERLWLAELYSEALGQLLCHLQGSGEFQRALEYARRGVRADPLREEMHRELIRIYAALGQPSAAWGQYRELERLLKQELHAEPSAGTRALVQRLLAQTDEGCDGRSASVASPPASDAASRKPQFHLPLPRSPLLGRDREVAAIQQLLRRPEVGLVTLTGTAGTGKTRLALQVAADLRDELPDGIFWVDLAPIRDPSLVTSAVVQVLGVRETGGIPLTQGLKESLRGKECLLLLDNFEQVVDAAPLLSEMLAAAPHLKLLVTSRVVLRLRDEHEYPVSPLALPDPERLPPFTDLLQYAAVELFVQRAHAARPEFALTQENGAAVAQICCRLDGLPLAIELAAARIRLFSPQAVLSRLGDRLGLLTAGARDLPARQQTLRAAIDWSYELLSEGERVLLGRLSVFAGGWTLAAAEGICSGGHPRSGSCIEGWEVLELLGQLVDKSLVVTEEQGEEVRYRLLETVRQYAWDRLLEAGEGEAVRERHGECFLQLAEAAHAAAGAGKGAEAFERLEPEHDNLRAALAWFDGRGAERMLRLAGALGEFWAERGYWNEGRQWLERALAGARGAVPTAERARALAAAGRLATHQRDSSAAQNRLEESIALYRRLGDTRGLVEALTRCSVALYLCEGNAAAAREMQAEPVALARALGDPRLLASALRVLGSVMEEHETARVLLEESLALARQVGDRRLMALSLERLGEISQAQGEEAKAREFLEESVALARAANMKVHLCNALFHLASVLSQQGDPERAKPLREECLLLARELRLPLLIGRAMISLVAHDLSYEEALRMVDQAAREYGPGLVATQPLSALGHRARERGDYEWAATCYRRSLALRQEVGDTLALARSLEDFAGLAARQQQWERAATLLGAVEAVCMTMGRTPPVAAPMEYERAVRSARVALGEEAFAAAWEAGRAMTLDDAIAFVLDETRDG